MFRSSYGSGYGGDLGNRPHVVRTNGQLLGTYRLFGTQNNGLYLEPNQPDPPIPTPNPPTKTPKPPTTTPDICTNEYHCNDCEFGGQSCQLVPGTECTFRCMGTGY